MDQKCFCPKEVYGYSDQLPLCRELSQTTMPALLAKLQQQH